MDFVARMEPTGRRDAPPDGAIRERRSRIALRSMRATVCGAIVFASAALAQQPTPPPAQPQQKLTIGFVDIEGDPRYEPVQGSDRIILKTREHPFTGAQVGLDEAQALTRVLKTDFALERITVKSAAEVASAVQQALETRKIHLFLVDAPAEAYKPLAAAVRGRDALVFNVSAPDDALRRDLCTAEVVHVIPSLAMRMDGLVQYLVSRKWRDYLVLEGPAAGDAVAAKTFESSAKKFGARIVAHQNFKAGTDPREREQNDPALLTAISRDYDVVFAADEAFDFVRQLSYHTVRPRPIVGGIDLEPVAWHWTWDHNGAPQVNSRFEKRSGGRHMESADWASWIAVKMIVQSALRTRSIDFQAQRKFILGDATFDGDKGLAVGVRPWDHQLRQAVLLAAPYSVVASAPVEGFLHRTNELDTLGDDEPETPCHLNK
ncbi:MAG TPA: amino acid ABC transporter substrate-binding protein [Xanthobacteraceae bacterium]|jgi:ABC transporter substrate binding protein (PQQ-dependent alcohol dehydrogenase system)